ncbi:tetratricopeptide repeat protein [Shewanella sp. NFH-SH190041]|uniref:tetratricopeptide repeat protein n=1 Tax=Shewanella sp. NFH-SH190041 TaxID=2950245 RepID=UPI0021C2F4B7|nr:tetratricopeptide repeat protein [Shewanella sp. NFH-SH190041]
MKKRLVFGLLCSLSSAVVTAAPPMSAPDNTASASPVAAPASTLPAPSESESHLAINKQDPFSPDAVLAQGREYLAQFEAVQWQCDDACIDYAVAAIDYLTLAADNGKIEARYLLGKLYFEIGDWKESQQWLAPAIAKGYAKAFTLMGKMVPDDEALSWFEKGVAAKDKAAADAIGSWYLDYKEDNSQALIWFKQAAADNDDNGLYHLGLMYQRGLGVSADPEQAMTLFRQAAALGNYCARQRVARYDSVQLIKGYQLAAEHGNQNAMRVLAVMYEHGFGVDADSVVAAKWQQQLNNKPRSFWYMPFWRYRLWQAMNAWLGIKADTPQLAKQNEILMAKGDINAALALGDQYHREAVSLFRQLAAEGCASAAEYTGVMYEHGLVLRASRYNAMKWYTKAVEYQGESGKGAIPLARHYLNGTLVAQNLEMAYMWFEITQSYFHNDAAAPYLKQLESQMPERDVTTAKLAAKRCMAKDALRDCTI